MEPTIEDRKIAKIVQFKEEFFTEFGEVALVAIEKKDFNITLEQLESLINDFVHKEYPGLFPEGIRTKSRKHELIMCRFCFYKLAIDIIPNKSKIARYMNVNPTSVLYGDNIIRGLIAVKESSTMFVINRIYHEFKERFGINADVQFDKSAKFNT